MISWWLLLLLVIVGHFALHLAIYNRINATGLPRWMIKVVKYFFLSTCIAIPCWIAWNYQSLFVHLWQGSLTSDEVSNELRFYGAVCLFTLVWYGPDWLRSRPPLNSDAISVQRQVRHYNVQPQVDQQLAVTRKCQLFKNLPLNQLFQLAIEEKQLPIVGLPAGLSGLKIAHFSDVHLTGHVSPAFYQHALDQALAWQPDIIALTGDIIDRRKCIDWLGDCFAHAEARLGCYFILGNHDLRVPDPKLVRDKLQSFGWINLGSRVHETIHQSSPIQMIGNESPWFPAASIDQQPPTESTLRIMLSHSPDQIDWARQHNVHLMLAGHTHGGQGRLPWIGPVLSPSWYGSRYASGTFHLQPTTMHVTRGLSGVHLMRINCPPELALLTLTDGAEHAAS